MPDKFFLDTNVIVYSFDASAPEKRQRARELIAEALSSGRGIISTQVVQEFLNVAIGKFDVPLVLEDSRKFLLRVLSPLCQVYPDVSLYEQALGIKFSTGYSFYDSLVIAGAESAACSLLYSEDMQDGHEIRGLRIVNPFAEKDRP